MHQFKVSYKYKNQLVILKILVKKKCEKKVNVHKCNSAQIEREKDIDPVNCSRIIIFNEKIYILIHIIQFTIMYKVNFF
jgi:hypothetical protein